MEFRVPKFLERESTIAWGLTFKDMAVAGILGLMLFTIYSLFFAKSANKSGFFFLLFITAGGFATFNFVKIRSQSIQEILFNAVTFLLSNKIYIWQKKEGWTPIKLVEKKQELRRKKESELLKISPKSRLARIHSKIDFTEAIPEEEMFEDSSRGPESDGGGEGDSEHSALVPEWMDLADEGKSEDKDVERAARGQQ